MPALFSLSISRQALHPSAAARAWCGSIAVASDTRHLRSHQGDTGTLLCCTSALEREKRLGAALRKGTQMFVFIAPPELIKILTFFLKKKLPMGMKSGFKKLQMGQ